MKIGELAIKAFHVGSVAAKAVAIGANKIWQAVKWIIFKDPVVDQICATNWGDGEHITPEQAAKVTSIGNVFQGNTEITSFDELSMFSNVKTLQNTFQDCSGLKTIDLTHIEHIDTNSFNGCSSLGIDVNMPNLKTMKGGGIFKNSGIVSVSNLGYIEEIQSVYNKDGAFQDCVELEIVVLPPTLRSIGVKDSTLHIRTFKGCSKLKAINLDNIEYICQEAFANCANLNIVFSSDKITNIPSSAFTNSGITGINLPNVTSIGNFAFNGTKIGGVLRLPNLETINAGGAFNKTLITEVADFGRIVNLSPAAGYGLFMSCTNLTKVVLPNTIAYIKGWAFYDARALNTLVIYAVTPPELELSAFGGTKISSGVIYVPDESVDAYKAATNWSNYADRIKSLSDYKEE